MKYFRYMWVSSSFDDRRAELFRKLNENTVSEEIYLIGVPESHTHLLDIYPRDILKSKYFQESDELVVGVAASLDEAKELAGGILQRVYKCTGEYDVSAYLSLVQKAEEESDD